jgi:hydrogenase expression/formation protein HypE
VLNIANEGKFVTVVSPETAEKCLDICKSHKLGHNAGIIGEITEADGGAIVEMITKIGGKRIVQMPYGRELPRIC